MIESSINSKSELGSFTPRYRYFDAFEPALKFGYDEEYKISEPMIKDER